MKLLIFEDRETVSEAMSIIREHFPLYWKENLGFGDKPHSIEIEEGEFFTQVTRLLEENFKFEIE